MIVRGWFNGLRARMQALWATRRHPHLRRAAWAIAPHFDAPWYRRQYMGCDPCAPLVHFLTQGSAAGHDPCPDFSTALYLARYADVAAAPVVPFVHFCTHGRREGRSAQSDRAVADAIQSRPPPPCAVAVGRVWLSLVVPGAGAADQARLRAAVAAQAMPGVELLFDLQDAAPRGAWVAVLGAGDDLAPHALRHIHGALQGAPQLQFLYTDAVAHGPGGAQLQLKPAFDPALLAEVHYTDPLALYRRDRWAALGGGVPDHGFCRAYVAGLPDAAIAHLPYPAVEVRRPQLRPPAQPCPPASTLPRVSIIIPSKDALGLIRTVLAGVFQGTDYPPHRREVLVVDNGSTDPKVHALYADQGARHAGFRVLACPGPFNFSRLVNAGIAAAQFETVLLLNNDIAVQDPGWLREMVACLDIPGTGIVGPKLLFPDGTIQHAGVIAGFGDLAGHWYMHAPGDAGGMMNRLHHRATMTCVTGAAMLITRACLDRVGPWDEDQFAVAYNDVDFCLRAHQTGVRTVWTPHASLIHRESATRGPEASRQKRRRFARESAALAARHGTQGMVDPTSHPALGRHTSVPWAQAAAYPILARTRFPQAAETGFARPLNTRAS